MTFVWAPIDGALRLVDVRYDDASLLVDYQNQFGRILAKDGPDGLLAALAKLEAAPQ